MRVLVDGGDYTPNDRIYLGIVACHETYGITELLHAPWGSKGDRLAAEWCRRKRIPIITAECTWNYRTYGGARKVAPKRNATMIAMKPDLLLAFKHGTGLMDMMRRAKAAGIPISKVDFS